MNQEQAHEKCILQHIDWKAQHPDRKVDEHQFAHQLGMDLKEYLRREQALLKSRLSITPPNSDFEVGK